MRTRSLSISAALGGRSAASLRSWLMMLGPSSVLVLFQEHAVLPWWLSVVSAVIQHLAVGVVLLPLAAIRTRVPIIPLPFMFLVWALVGVVRAVAGAGIVVLVTGTDPHLVYRLLFWAGVSMVWTPLFVYAVAQRQHRRLLLGAWADEREQLRIESDRSHRSTAQLRSRLVDAVRESVLPVIHEIQLSLSSVQLRGEPLAAISGRLGSVTRDATRIIELDSPEPPRSPGAPPTRPGRVAARDYLRQRPLYVSFLTAFLVTTILLPGALLEGGVSAALFLVPVLAVTFLAQLAALVLAGLEERRGILPIYTAFTVAALSGVAVILLTAPRPLDLNDLALSVVLLPAVLVAAGTLSAAIGLGLENEDLATSLDELEAQVQSLRATSIESETRVRDQVSALMHGPVLGRLSACVMALNFHSSSAEANDQARTAEVTRNVLDHLALAARDLESLA